ncbi:hypothetical protein [Planctomyces sp. SH-PL62]|uniref:hypothetical protein n=1 Tax=Planctomyces sp. SH-PL62 TaxID=1636152 RepID=UPI00078E9235|nr:hypothetical protein [Planctomyces sp. SH-PL62]AMV37111.1 hypothetical protein VT85_06745 [Planctomyces sp. SH-PL62]
MDPTAREADAAPKLISRRALLTLAILTPVLAGLVLAGIYGAFYVVDRTPKWVYWAIGLRFLQGVDVAYGIAVVGAVGGLGWVLVRARAVGSGAPRRAVMFRVALLCGTTLAGVLVLEAASAVILVRQRRESVLPAGGWTAALNEAAVARKLPNTVDEVELPTTFPEQDDRVSIAVVGESSAAGVPYTNWLSIGSVVAWGLERAIPGRTFRHEVMARSGDTLERQHRHLADLHHRPDVLIVYCGHNEFSARIPLSRDRTYYNDDEKPARAAVLAEKAVAWSFLHALVQRNIQKCRIAIPPPDNGHRDLVDAPAYSPEEYDLVLNDFRNRLEAIATYAEKLGAILVLVSPPGNDSGYDPNRSFLPPETPRAERRAIASEFLSAKGLETSDPSASVAAYRDLLERAPGFAAARWRLSRLLADRGDKAEAYEQAVAARDLDGYPQRCLTEFQDAYRETARRHDAILVDGQAYFHALSPDGLLDERLFHDAMHPSYRGHLALAQAVLRGLHARRAFGWAADAPAPVVDPVEAAQHFKIDAEAWRYLCLWGMMSYEITGPASYDPTVRLLMQETFARAAASIKKGVPAADVGLPNIGRMEPIPLVPFGGPSAEATP